MRRTGRRWVLVTEWGTYGSSETSEEESALPGGTEGEPDAKQILTWVRQLSDHDEEVVFRAALALGAHGVQGAVGPLCFLLSSRGLSLLPLRLFKDDPAEADPEECEFVPHAILAAAIALGQIKNADAVRTLFGHGLRYEHVLVRTAVREALHSITGNEISISDPVPESRVGRLGMSEEEWSTMRLQQEWDKWWEENEDAVRKKLKKEK